MYTILAIDGGGIRGIIPAVILDALVQKTSTSPALMFDCIAGTSTGAILAAGMATPWNKGTNKPRHSTRDIIGQYESFGPLIFRTPLARYLDDLTKFGRILNPANNNGPINALKALGKPIQDITLLAAILRGKYLATREAAEAVDTFLQNNKLPLLTGGILEPLLRHGDDLKLSEMLTRLLLTSYDLNSRDVVVFDSSAAQDQNVPVYQAVTASAAAPSYFAPYLMKRPGQSNSLSLIDGGVALENPAAYAYAKAVASGISPDDILVVSIGCGKHTQAELHETVKEWGPIKWLLGEPPTASKAASDSNPRLLVTNVMIDAIADAVDQQMEMLLGSRYVRLQLRLRESLSELDNGDPAFIAQLRARAETYVNSTGGQTTLNNLHKLLLNAGKIATRRPRDESSDRQVVVRPGGD